MNDNEIELDSATDLDALSYEAIVAGTATVTISDVALQRVGASRAAFLAHLATGAICYGVTTGLGAMSTLDLSAAQRAALPRHTLLGRASGTGKLLPAGIGRGAVLAKLVQFLDGRSAVTPELCRVIADRLNRGIVPAMPSHGFGMAGEIIPLSHAVQPLIGEGLVIMPDGAVISAGDWHVSQGIEPYEPQLKEGLSLINGTGVGPAAAWHLGGRAAVLLVTANLVSATSIEGLAAPIEAYSEMAATMNADPNVI
jgi:histidine ammonia-lyase